MKTLIKILKIISILLIIAVSIIGGIVVFENFQFEQRKLAELSYNTKYKWEWHDESDRIQIRFNETSNKSVLRKVYTYDNYIVYAMKGDDHSLLAVIEFIVPCQPNTSIETSKKFGSGNPIILECNDEGTALTIGAKWSGKDTDVVWSEKLDGFDFRVNFGDWDFSKLDQEVTLSKAQ